MTIATARQVLVTGTGGGLGREMALRFAALGDIVHGCDIKAETNAETARLVAAAGGKMRAATVDIGDPDAAAAWVKSAAAATGSIDVLVNNASAARFAPISDFPVEDWQFTVRNELDTVFYVTRAAWAPLSVKGGVIINIASVAGWHGTRAVGNLAHCATKGAVLALTRQLAIEGSAVKIRALSISPGFVLTPGTAEVVANPAVRQALEGAIPVGRAGQPADIAAMTVFAASDQAGYLNGSDIVIDGGMSA